MVISYEDRELDHTRKRWNSIIRKRAQTRKLSKLVRTLNMTTGAMKAVDYIEAWSLTTFLIKRPKEFEKLVDALRGGKKVREAIQEIYKLDAKNLARRWQRHAMSQR